MEQFLHGYAVGSDPRELVNTCLSQIGDVPPEASLGVLYLTDALAREAEHLSHLLEHATGIDHWIGTVGLAIATTGLEIYDQPAMAVMLLDIPVEGYRQLSVQPDSTQCFIEDNRGWIEAHHPAFGMLHGDPTNPEIPQWIERFSEDLGEGFFVGGLTSSQSLQTQVSNGIGSGGLSGVVFSSDVEVIAGHTQGCTPIGPVHTISEAQGNVITRIDQQPALSVLKADVGEVLARDLKRLGGYVFAGLPVPQSDRGDYLVRSLIGIDTNQGLVAIGDLVEAGDALMFCRRDGNTAREDMLSMLDDLDQRRNGRQIRGGFYYSCLGRGRHQFGEDSEEVKMIHDVLGDFPLVGFFANGEIFHNRLYGFTGVLSLFL